MQCVAQRCSGGVQTVSSTCSTRRSSRLNAAVIDAPTARKACERVQLGQSDLQVSACCLGTMTWGKQNTEAQAHEQLSYAWDSGLNFMDTAEMYPVPTEESTQGLTEQYIGTWLRNRKREDIVLATKVSGFSTRSTYMRNPPETLRVNKKQVLAAVDASLKRLQTDYVDLLQIHWPDRYVPLFGGSAYDISQERDDDIPFEEQLEALENVVKAGKVRYVGVSNETSYGVSEFVHTSKATGLPRIQTIQNVYHLLSRIAYETDLAETCRRHDVSLLAYSPLAGGSLSGKYLSNSPPPGSRLTLFPGYMGRYMESLARSSVEEYTKVAKKYGMTPTQLALAWCNSRWFVTSTIIGATSIPQLKENLEAFDLELPQEAVDEINAIYRRCRDPPNSP